MCDTCKNEINQFRYRSSTPSPWLHLDRKLVADRLEEIIYKPDTIQQGAIGFCGLASFLRAWVLNDHLSVVRFTIQLFENGKASLNGETVEPCSEMLECDYPRIKWENDNGDALPPCPQTDWMIMGTFQNYVNIFLDFEGTPGETLSDGCTPGNVKDCLELTGLYQSVSDETYLINIGSLRKGYRHALGLYPTEARDVILMINATLIAPSLLDTGVWSFYNNNVSNHFISLCSHPILVVDNGIEYIEMTYFTWGSVRHDRFSVSDFDEYYFGAIITEAKQPKRPLPVFSPVPPSIPYGLSAKMENSNIIFNWLSSSLLDENYIVESAWSGDNTIKFTYHTTVWASRPSTIGGKCIKVAPAINDFAVAWFRVKAINQYGQSDFSKVLLINTGTKKTKSPYGHEAAPAFLQQVTVLRAIPNQTPTGYARFAEASSDFLKPQVIYDVLWSQKYGQNTRKIEVTENKPSKPDRAIYFFLRFNYQMRNLHLNLLYTDPYGAQKNQEINLQPVTGSWPSDYWGTFIPTDYGRNYDYQLIVSGEDILERYYERGFTGSYGWNLNRMGNLLDSNPSSVAAADLNNAPQYPFINYEPGLDRNHKVQIGTVIKSLLADRLENNNSFATATNVVLTLDPEKLTQEYNDINLNNSADSDVFYVDYQGIGTNYILNNDSALINSKSGGLKAGRNYLSSFLGLYIDFIVPSLSITLHTDQKECIDLEVYKSDKVIKVKDYKKESAVKFSPMDFNDCKFYLVVKNSDYNMQGAFPYRMNIAYAPGYYAMGIDHNAPAYQAQGRIDYKYLKKLLDKLDLPRPSENWKVTIERDIREVVKQTANILLDKNIADELKEFTGQSFNHNHSIDYKQTAMIASSFGLATEAELLYNERLKQISSVTDKTLSVEAYNDLHGFYLSNGMKTKANALKKKIIKITR